MITQRGGFGKSTSRRTNRTAYTTKAGPESVITQRGGFRHQNDRKRNRSESALIRNIGGGSIWSPVPRFHDPVNAPVENG